MIGLAQTSYVTVDEEIIDVISDSDDTISKSSPLNLSSGYNPKTFVDDAIFFDSVRAESVSIGFRSSCIVYDDQSLTCTGYNYQGLLGAGFATTASPYLEKEHIKINFPEPVKVSQVEAGYDSQKFFVDNKTPDYYHPGKSGRLFLNNGKNQIAAYFGEIHPNILKQIDIKTESLVGFEIFMENLELPKKTLKDLKVKFSFSDYQKSERDFAFIVNKEVKAQDLIDTISNVDESLIKDIKVFDVYEGDNIPENQKSIAISVTIQSSERTLNENDLEKINNLIIKTVENKTGAKIRS